jgi:GT2 family glycosyltransferase
MSLPPLPSLSLIIATLNRLEPLSQLLSDLATQRGAEFDVWIADQGTPPQAITPAAIPPALKSRVEIMRCEPGVVAARNAAGRAATGEVLVFLDDDARLLSPDFLQRHAANYLDLTVSAVCGQELFPPDFTECGPDRSQFADAFEEAEFFSRNSTERRDVAHLCTCNCSVRRDAWLAVGGFDSRYTGNSYGDDTDLALRLKAVGQRIVFDPTAAVKHLRWASGGLRLSDRGNSFSERDRYLSAWLLYYLHVPPKWRRWYLWHRVIRKSLLLRRNATQPGRWPGIVRALWASRREAWALARR